MSSYYNIYCDESGIDGGSIFFFGGLYCTPQRADILRNELTAVRKQFGLNSEMKWTKVSKKMLPAYKAFVDVFINDPYSRFLVRYVKRGSHWVKWASSEEERFFKAYYAFLRWNISIFNRYGIYLDYKPGKWYRWKSLKYAINRAILRDDSIAHNELVHTLKPVDSKDEDLIQIVDLILGAMTSQATAMAKIALANHVKFHQNDLTKSKKKKIIVDLWEVEI